MKTSTFAALSAALLLTLTFGTTQTANAQGFNITFGDDISFSVKGGSNGIGRSNGAYIDEFGNVVVVNPVRRRPIQPVPFNPVVDQQRSGAFKYNPSTGRWELKQTTDTIHASALDQNRGVVDPGSLRSKSSVARDGQGNTIETTVTSWTSYGVPHSNTTTRRIQQGNNGRVIDERNVMRSTGPTETARPSASPTSDRIPGFDD